MAPHGDRLPRDWHEIATQDLLVMCCATDVSEEAKQQAYTQLFQRYSVPIRNYMRLKVRSAEDVEDLLSEVWERALKRLPQFVWRTETHSEDPLRSWLYTIAHFVVLEFYQQAPLTPLHLVSTTLNYLDQHETLTGFEHEAILLSATQTARRATELIQQAKVCLTQEEYRVIMLTFYRSKNSQEIGMLLRLTSAHVRMLRSRAYKKLRRYLESHAGVSERNGGG